MVPQLACVSQEVSYPRCQGIPHVLGKQRRWECLLHGTARHGAWPGWAASIKWYQLHNGFVWQSPICGTHTRFVDHVHLLTECILLTMFHTFCWQCSTHFVDNILVTMFDTFRWSFRGNVHAGILSACGKCPEAARGLSGLALQLTMTGLYRHALS